jgi:hypothetical protein
MSVAIRTKRLTPSPVSTFDELSLSTPPARHEAEAPELACRGREAPESRAGRLAEAPDAGEGRAGLLEHEFTHGRSQS